MVAMATTAPTSPTINQYIPFRPGQQRDEPDIPDSVNRSTEERAFRTIAMRAHYRSRAGGREGLPALHLELLRLERGALQHLPQLNWEERMEFIAAAAHLRNVTPRQIESYLDQASDRLMLQELSGLSTIVDDFDEVQVKRLYQNANRADKRRGSGASTRSVWGARAVAR